MSIFTSWYDHQEEKIRFWLEFQVIHDGFFSSPPSPSSPTPSPTTSLSSSSSPSPSPSTKRPAPLTHFHLFPSLPYEIRLLIWTHTIHPRILLAACLNPLTASSKRTTTLSTRPTYPPIPPILHTCRESRHFALSHGHYEPAFAWKIPSRLAGPETGVYPASSPPRVYFNFALDALFLAGDLEPFDQYGFNSPMVYFLKKEDTARVRHVACAFEELKMSLYESDQVFGSLFHIIDRFPRAKRLLITATQRDVEVRGKLGMVLGGGMPTADNVVQKLWCAFMTGTTSTSLLAKRQILMLREEDLPGFVEDQANG